MTPIHVEIDSSYADHKAATKLHLRHKRQGRLIFIYVTGTIFGLEFYNLVRYRNPGWIETILLPCLYVWFLVTLLPMWRFMAWREWRKLAKVPETHASVMATYTDKGADVTTLNTRTSCNWDAFSHYVEGPNVFLLYLDQDRFVYLPKRVLTPEQVDAFRELMVRHVRLTRFQKRQPAGFPVQSAEPIAPLPGNSALSEAPPETRQVNS